MILLITIVLIGLILAVKDYLDKIRAVREDIIGKQMALSQQLLAGNLTLLALKEEYNRVDKRYETIEKSMITIRLMTERMHDPEWMDQFDQGRGSAPWN